MATIHFIDDSGDNLTGLFLTLSNIEQAAKYAATQCLRLEYGAANHQDVSALVDSVQRMAGKLSGHLFGGGL